MSGPDHLQPEGAMSTQILTELRKEIHEARAEEADPLILVEADTLMKMIHIAEIATHTIKLLHRSMIYLPDNCALEYDIKSFVDTFDRVWETPDPKPTGSV
jgi:hypothetical protein